MSNRFAQIIGVLGFVLLAGLAGRARADAIGDQRLPEFRDDRSWPIDELPEGITAEDGVISAYADFEHPTQPRYFNNPIVPIYVINRSDEPRRFDLVNLFALFFLEVQVDGRWSRAEVRIAIPGSPSDVVTVEPGRFIMVAGYLPQADGEHEAPARYRYFNGEGDEIVTNVGVSVYLPEEREQCQLDHRAMQLEADRETLLSVINGTHPRRAEFSDPGNMAGTAGYGLGLRYPQDALALLRQWDAQTYADPVKRNVAFQMIQGFLFSRRHTLDELVALQRDGLGCPYPSFNEQMRDGLMFAIARQFPDQAIAMIEALDREDPATQTMRRSGLNGLISEQASFDRLVWCLHQELAGLEELVAREQVYSSAAAFIGGRYPEQGLALREALRERYGEAVDPVIHQMEQYVTHDMSEEVAFSLLEGRLEMQVYPQRTAVAVALQFAASRYTVRAQEAVERWSAGDDPALRERASELQGLLRAYGQRAAAMEQIEARLKPRSED